jgi:hypothetical protein
MLGNIIIIIGECSSRVELLAAIRDISAIYCSRHCTHGCYFADYSL